MSNDKAKLQAIIHSLVQIGDNLKAQTEALIQINSQTTVDERSSLNATCKILHLYSIN
jgi:hypothetical protein